jgi:hypothetical protein
MDDEIMGYWTISQWTDFSLALLSGVVFLADAIFITIWTWELRQSDNPLYPLFPTIVGFKLTLSYWAFGNTWAMLFDYNFPPFSTLPPRIAFLILALIQLRVIWRIERRRKNY